MSELKFKDIKNTKRVITEIYNTKIRKAFLVYGDDNWKIVNCKFGKTTLSVWLGWGIVLTTYCPSLYTEKIWLQERKIKKHIKN